MFNKLEAVASRYEQIAAELSQPQTVADTELFTKLMKEHAALSPIVEKYREYVSAQQAEKEALQIIAENGGDKELKELAEEELKEAKARAAKKRRFLRERFTECIPCIPNPAAGTLRL